MIDKLLGAVPKWAWIALAAALAATSCKLKWDKDGLSIEIEKTRTELATKTAQYEGERADAADKLAELTAQYRDREQALLAAAQAREGERDAKIADAVAVADDLRRRLRAATAATKTAPTNVPAPAPAPEPKAFAAGTVGAFLRDHAPDFAGGLVDEAQRAEVIRQELLKCYADYDDARQQLQKE